MTPPLMVSGARARVSAVILTRNEEALIERCLRSIRDVVDDIIVVDSCSTDSTREIATHLGARVVEQPWLGWIRQRALGIQLAQHDWVLILEADEIVTPRLASSIREALASHLDPADGFSIDRRDDFLGVLLPSMRRSKKRKSFVRLFNRTRSAYDPTLVIHDEVRVAGRTAPLAGIMIHWRGFTIVQQVARYTHYAPLEAEVMEAKGERVSVASLAWRPFLRFGWCYFICGGFRLGARGFAHALMVASSEYLRFAAVWERQQAPATLHPSADVDRAYLSEEASADTRVSTPSPVSRGMA
ncbi:MAG: glycosyltransferase family 2 protein [Gemmatimonadaceae bacterium]